MLNKLKNIKIEISVFVAGFVVMVYEIIGSRVVTPYMGNSIFVWTSLIGVILASLSLGYYMGGKRADKQQNTQYLSNLFFYSSILIFATNIISEQVIQSILSITSDLRIASLIAGLVIFSPPSILLGAISTYSIKLKLDNLTESGKTVGRMYSISSAGSILGTFLAGFYLFVWFKTRQIITLLAILLTLNSILLNKEKTKLKKLIILLCIFIYGYFVIIAVDKYLTSEGYLDTDSSYNRILVFDGIEKKTNKSIRVLSTGKGSQSVIYTNEEDLFSDYLKYFDLADHFNKNIKDVLMLGGGAYIYPMHYSVKNSESEIDVVEIDPELRDIAAEYFNYLPSENIKEINMGARRYINEIDKTYDAIFLDVYGGDLTIPFQLTTLEFISELDTHLNPNGIIISNIISALEGKGSKFLKAEINTYLEVFDKVFIFLPNRNEKSAFEGQNVVLVALKSEEYPHLYSENEYYDRMLSTRYIYKIPEDEIVLTDDYAPVEQLSAYLLTKEFN